MLEYSINEQSRPGVNLIANIMQIMEERGILFKNNDNTHGIPEFSKPQTYLIKIIILLSTIYIKIQNKDELLMTWIDFTRKYRQNDSGRIPRWFRILESMIIIDEHRNINIAQYEVLGMHKLTNQIPDDLETMERDAIYIYIPNTLLSQ
ncbi:hypothetical protein G9A89_011186 [Geosiphon pyriformis]|nr:hypothetical protein G9A89_011186 [Geosiphon pyriformis]